MKNRKTLVIFLVLFNFIIWIFFIIPGFFHFINPENNLNDTLSSTNRLAVESEEVVSMDFSKMRDPFSFYQFKSFVKIKPFTNKRSDMPGTKVDIGNDTYISRLILKSITCMNNVYMAIIQDIPSYGSLDDNAINSYRMEGVPDTETGETHIVSEGSIVNGETVFRITNDFIILKKGNQYYRLTITNGSPVRF